MKKVLWAAVTILLVLCLRVNAVRTIDGAAECLTLKKVTVPSFGCETSWLWTISLKLPWRRW